MFKVEEMAIELIEALQPVVSRVRARDRALADQLTRASSSVALNIGEANYSDPGNRRARLFTASGSAGETRSVLRVAVASRHCTAEEAKPSRELLENIVPILWKLTH
jgi:four helix bundle protein